MKFFKPEDFLDPEEKHISHSPLQWYANLANAKLEREGKVVYSHTNIQSTEGSYNGWTTKQYDYHHHKALLINIEPIEVCKHEANKVKCTGANVFEAEVDYTCECGARVEPSAYKAVEG